MNKSLLTLLLILAVSSRAHADSLGRVDPSPAGYSGTAGIFSRITTDLTTEVKSTIRDSVHDKSFAVAVWPTVAAYSADEITTKIVFNECKICDEGGPIFTGSRSAARQTLVYAAIDFASLVTAHAIKYHVKNRWLRRLWVLIPAERTWDHAEGAEQNINVLRVYHTRP